MTRILKPHWLFGLMLLTLMLPRTACADWTYEAGYSFGNYKGEAPQSAHYNGDLQGLHVAFREGVDGWRGELAGNYQIGHADLKAPAQTLDSSDETAWSAEYRIGPMLAPGVWAFSGLAHRRWDSDADHAQLQRQFTYSPLGLGLALPPAWGVTGEVVAEYWAVWKAEVHAGAGSIGELPDGGSGWRLSLDLAWPYGDQQSLLVNPFYADWRLNGGSAENAVDAQIVGINLGLRWR